MSCNWMHARAYSIDICCFIYVMMIEGSLIYIEDYTVRIKVSIQDGADYFVIFLIVKV